MGEELGDRFTFDTMRSKCTRSFSGLIFFCVLSFQALTNIENQVFTVESFSPVDWKCVLSCVRPELDLLEPAVRDILDKGVEMLRCATS